MNTFEQDMKEAYKKLENDMQGVANMFNYKNKGYMAENIMLMDFNKEAFNEALAIIDKYFKVINADHKSYSFDTGVWETELRITTYPKNNRISFIF